MLKFRIVHLPTYIHKTYIHLHMSSCNEFIFRRLLLFFLSLSLVIFFITDIKRKILCQGKKSNFYKYSARVQHILFLHVLCIMWIYSANIWHAWYIHMFVCIIQYIIEILLKIFYKNIFPFCRWRLPEFSFLT